METAMAYTLSDGSEVTCFDHDAGLYRDRREVRCAECDRIVWALPEDDPWPADEPTRLVEEGE